MVGGFKFMKFKQFSHAGELGEFLSRLAEVVEKHTETEGDRAAYLAEKLWLYGIFNSYEVYNRSKDINLLTELDRAIAIIQRVLGDTGPLTPPAYLRLFHEVSSRSPIKVGEEEAQPDVHLGGQQENLSIYEVRESNRSALHQIVDHGDTIRAGIKRTNADIETSHRTRSAPSKINLRAIGLVSASRFIWELAQDKAAPTKDLNTASRFGSFLADVFETCRVDGDPRSAFRAWVREGID